MTEINTNDIPEDVLQQIQTDLPEETVQNIIKSESPQTEATSCVETEIKNRTMGPWLIWQIPGFHEIRCIYLYLVFAFSGISCNQCADFMKSAGFH